MKEKIFSFIILLALFIIIGQSTYANFEFETSFGELEEFSFASNLLNEQIEISPYPNALENIQSQSNKRTVVTQDTINIEVIFPTTKRSFHDQRYTVDLIQKEFSFNLEGQEEVKLKANLYMPKISSVRMPAIIILPGSGNVSRYGKVAHNGLENYDLSKDVTDIWASRLAESGLVVYSFDKRTCTPSDDFRCRENPTSDLILEGPKAYAKDIDAACENFLHHPKINHKKFIILSFDESAQAIFSTKCIEKAKSLVLFAPIPTSIDEVIVAGRIFKANIFQNLFSQEFDTTRKNYYQHRYLKYLHEAKKLEGIFNKIRQNEFNESSQILGHRVGYWKEWIELTFQSPNLFKNSKSPILYLFGEKSSFYSPLHQGLIKELPRKHKDLFYQINNADHYGLQNGILLESDYKNVLNHILDFLY